MPIEHTTGATTLTGDSIAFYRLAAMRGAVGLELKGIKMTRGPVVWKRAAREFGITPCTKQAVYDWLCAKVAELKAQQEHIETTEDGRRVRSVAGVELS
jgi:hypothetical protein